MQERDNYTPNKIADLFPFKFLEEKPKSDPNLINLASKRLPISVAMDDIKGSGDWVRFRSSEGSVVVGGGDMVVKIPLGTMSGDPIDRARVMMSSITHFSDVSPKTTVIIARADNDSPKPILIQKDVKGKPVCHSDIKDLYKLKPLYDLKEILNLMKDWHKDHNSHDMFGQKIKMNMIGRIMQYAPFLSDNVMLCDNGRIYLVDNVLYDKPRPKNITSKVKNFVKRGIFEAQIGFVDTLILTRRIHNFVFRQKEDSVFFATQLKV